MKQAHASALSREWVIKEKDNGKRLDVFLTIVLPEMTRGEIQQLIQQKKVFLENEEETRSHARLKPGRRVRVSLASGEVALPQKKALSAEESLAEPQVVAETEAFLVINKPAGMAMHPAGKRVSYTLAGWISTRYPQIVGVGEEKQRPGIVHRLDKDTSGVVVIAKTQKAFLALKKLFQERKMEKTYAALVYGNVKAPSGRIEAPLGRIRGGEKRGTPAGKRVFAGELRAAETEYVLHTRYPQYDFLSVKPKTGRTHQIRVHLSDLGHPIVGDRLYRFKEHRQDMLRPPFQLLHAETLRFTLFKKEYSFSAPLPSYFLAALKRLRSISPADWEKRS